MACPGPAIPYAPFGWAYSPISPPERVVRNHWTNTPPPEPRLVGRFGLCGDSFRLGSSSCHILLALPFGDQMEDSAAVRHAERRDGAVSVSALC